MEKTIFLAELPPELAGSPLNRKLPELPNLPDLDEEENKLAGLQKLGIMSVKTVTKEVAKQVAVTFAKGVLVDNVRPFSAAAVENLGRGMIITHVMDTPVATVEELTAELGKHDLSTGARLQVAADGNRHFVYLALPH